MTHQDGYDSVVATLKEAGIGATSNRVLVLRQLLQAECPLSLTDIDTALETLDKSSILRVLNLFLEHSLVHAVEDGRGVAKYEICHGDHHEHSEQDMHCHFYCTGCRRTFCMEDVAVPAVPVPEGFRVESVNYMLKGLCPDCKRKQHES